MGSGRWSLLSMCFALLLAISGCGGSSGTTTTLNVWARGAEGELLGRLSAEYEAQHPGVRIQVTSVPAEAAHAKYLTAVAAARTPDVALLGTTWMAEFARTGALAAVPRDVDLSQFFPGAARTVQIDSTAYGVPWYVETRVLYYRTDLARRAGVRGPPRTWEELKAAARAMQARGGARYGIYLSTSNWLEFLPFLWQAGGDVLKDGRVVLNTAEAKEAFSFYKSFFDERLTPTSLRADFQIVPEFVRGTMPMFFSGPWQMGIIRQVGGPSFEGKWAVAPVPAHRTRLSFVGGGNWGVFKTSRQRDAAWAFVRWMSRPQTQARWFELSSDLPANRAAWKLPPLRRDEHVRVFGDQLRTARAPSPNPRWEQYAHALEVGLDGLMRSRESGAEGARQLEASLATVASQ